MDWSKVLENLANAAQTVQGGAVLVAAAFWIYRTRNAKRDAAVLDVYLQLLRNGPGNSIKFPEEHREMLERAVEQGKLRWGNVGHQEYVMLPQNDYRY